MTSIDCTCGSKHAAGWHDELCPWFQHQCEACDGEGRYSVQLGCGCCSDSEICEECNGTGVSTDSAGESR